MTIWPPEKERLKRPAYRAIAQALVEAVEAGEISDGARLPPHRTLAYDLGVSVHTVSRAYEELSRMGLIRGEIGRGSFVTVASPELATPWQTVEASEDVIDLSMLVPVSAEAQGDLLRKTLASLSENLSHSAFGSFRPRTTLRGHCEIAARWLARCGVRAPRERILPTNGCTSAMTVALMTAALPGDTILTEAIGHHTIKALSGALGLKPVGVAMDREGVIPEAVDEAASHGARVIFVMPSGLGPTAAFMGDARREALVEVARRRELMIVENDAWGPIVAETPRPLACLAPERTLYLTGLSKFTIPGLRIGWLVVPDRLIATAKARHLVTSWMATPLIAEIASRWIADGTVSELLEFQREQFRRRNVLAEKAFRGLDFSSMRTGMHVWLKLPDEWNVADFVAHARNDRVAVAASTNFQIGETGSTNGVRVCLGGVSEGALAEGLRILSVLAKSTPEPALLTM